MKTALVFLSSILAIITFGQDISLVADINTKSISYDTPIEFFILKNKLYHIQGGMTYAYDGINPARLAYPKNTLSPFVLNNNVFFSTNSPGEPLDIEFWIYDGLNPPAMLSFFNNDASGDNIPSNFSEFNNKLYFTVNDGIHGSELWVYDWVNAPYLVADIIAGSVGSKPENLMVLQNSLYFTINDGSLWKYDGTNPPSVDITFGSIVVSSLVLYNNKIYYAGEDDIYGTELWEYDGLNPPSMLADINEGISSSTPCNLTIVNDKLYFNAEDAVFGNRNWIYNGTNPPMVADKLTGFTNILSSAFIGVLNDKLYFLTYGASAEKFLWVYDDINPPKKIAVLTFCSFLNIIEYRDILYYGIHRCHSTTSYWMYDGINPPVEANLGMTAGSDPFNKTLFDNKLYFVANDGTHGNDLWVYDGTNTPSMIADLDLGSNTQSIFLIVMNNKLYLINEYKILVYDGTNPPMEVATIDYFWNYYVFNNKLHFVSRYAGAFAVWVFDGTNSPEYVADINSNSTSFTTVSWVTFNNKLYFNAWDAIHGDELWVCDGTNPATMVADINIGSSGSGSYNLAVFNNRLFFAASDGIHGSELWVYDGISSPAMVDDISSGSGSSSPSSLTVLNNKLYFKACGDGSHSQLWVYNGIDKPTMVQGDYVGLSESSYPRKLFPFHNKLIFESNDAIHGCELWEYDEINPPKMLIDLDKGSPGSLPYGFTVLNNKLYFVAEYVNGLWEYDGIIPPVMVKDVNGDYSGSYARELIAYNNNLYFTANQPNTGRELYVLNLPDTTITVQACDRYNFNGTLLTNSGIYYGTVPGMAGGDSIIGINLTIINSSSSTINAEACESYISSSGMYIWTSSGTYLDTIPNSTGCDSVITVILIIKNSKSTINSAACESYTSPSGMYTWTSSGTYLDTIPNSAGCDSVITVNLIIKNSKSTINPTACDSYTSPSGRYTWTSSGTYLDTIPTAAGCDSVVIVELNIDTVNTSVLLYQKMLISNDTKANHQWIDCDNGNKPIDGETYQTFAANKDGHYAVIVSRGACVDTSTCCYVNITDMGEDMLKHNIILYPNPVTNELNVVFETGTESGVLEISTIKGEGIIQQMFNGAKKLNINVSELTPGMYILQIKNDKKVSIMKIVKE